jgi:hypothetical protein
MPLNASSTDYPEAARSCCHSSTARLSSTEWLPDLTMRDSSTLSMGGSCGIALPREAALPTDPGLRRGRTNTWHTGLGRVTGREPSVTTSADCRTLSQTDKAVSYQHTQHSLSSICGGAGL